MALSHLDKAPNNIRIGKTQKKIFAISAGEAEALAKIFSSTPPDTLVCNVAIHSTDTLVNYIHLLSVRKKYRKNKSLDFLTLAIFLPIYYKKIFYQMH